MNALIMSISLPCSPYGPFVTIYIVTTVPPRDQLLCMTHFALNRTIQGHFTVPAIEKLTNCFLSSVWFKSCFHHYRSFVLSFIRSCVRACIRSFVISFVRSCFRAFFLSFIHSFVRSFIRSRVRSCSRSFVRSFIRSCFRSFVISFVRSRVRAFVS